MNFQLNLYLPLLRLPGQFLLQIPHLPRTSVPSLVVFVAHQLTEPHFLHFSYFLPLKINGKTQGFPLSVGPPYFTHVLHEPILDNQIGGNIVIFYIIKVFCCIN